MVKDRDHITVQPGETYLYAYTLSVKGPGPIDAQTTLYLEENGIRQVRVKVRGVAVAPSGRPGGPKTPSQGVLRDASAPVPGNRSPEVGS